MSEPRSQPSREEALAERLQALLRALRPQDQSAARELIRGEKDYYRHMAWGYLSNPFLKLSDEEFEVLKHDTSLGDLRAVIWARGAARRSKSPKYAVFCMPKSGSSFVATALEYALELPRETLTGFGLAGVNSYFGMNSRAQEIDELALIKAILSSPAGFVTQAHTPYSQYLGLQMQHFGIRPIVTVRNVLDCIVSFDDMMLSWREGQGALGWLSDAQFTLPANYPELPEAERYELLARSFGVWLIGFYVCWKRGAGQGIVKPLSIRYDTDILDRQRFVARVSEALQLTAAQRSRLAAYAERPDPQRSRLNVGRRGRGAEKIPDHVKQLLRRHVGLFAGELGPEEIEALIG